MDILADYNADLVNQNPALLDQWRKKLFELALTSQQHTLFTLIDGLASGAQRCGCPAHTSLNSPIGHAAMYRALSQGGVDPDAALQIACQIGERAGLPRIYAIDTTAWPRPNSPTSPDRQPQYTPGGSRGTALIKTGWRYQQIVRLTMTADSWVLPILTERITSEDDPVEVTIRHITQVCAVDGSTPGRPSLFLLDSGYPAARITQALRDQRICADVLVRLSTSQAFWTRPEVKQAHPLGGRPRRHGFRLGLKDPQLPPDAGITAPLDIYGNVTVRVWHRVHPKISRSTRGFEHHTHLPTIEGSVLIASVQHLRPSRRAGDLALWYSGTSSDLLTLVMTYLARFDIEHYFRYLKTTARAQDFHPQQPQTQTTWLQLHAWAYTHLFLARPQLTHQRLPWEKHVQPVMTPGQVRRQVSHALHKAWQPPGKPKPGHPGPGRPAGRRRKRRERHRIIRKNAFHKGK